MTSHHPRYPSLGLRQPSAGTVRFAGLPARAAVRAGHVGAMLQVSGLPSGARVGDVLRLAAALHRHGPRPRELAGLAGLGDLARRDVETLSGGQAHRLRFAVAAGRPRLLFLDEPTVAMDVESRQHFWSALRQMAGAGTTVLFSTHLLHEADEFADRVVVISAGRLVAAGTPGRAQGRHRAWPHRRGDRRRPGRTAGTRVAGGRRDDFPRPHGPDAHR